LKRSSLAILLPTAATAALLVAFSARAKPAATVAANAVAAPAVNLTAVKAVQSAPSEEVVGGLEPLRQLRLAFETQGRLARILVKKGAAVSVGQLIAQLDTEMADAQVQQAEAAVKAAEAQGAIASDSEKRQTQLGASGAVSEQQLRNSTQGALAAAAQLQAAKAQLAQMRALRKRHDLRAPFAGVLIDAPDQVGTTVAVGAALFTLEQLDQLVLKLTVSDAARAALKVGTQLPVTAVGGAARSDGAYVRLVLPSADPATRRVPVEVLVPNQDGRFTAHTLARAILPLGAAGDALSIPASALSSQGGDHVYVVQDSEVRRIPVDVLDRGATLVVLKSAVPLQNVVDYPAADLADGVKVSVK
jgi:membrane fusion protein (multidrug efflux system)